MLRKDVQGFGMEIVSRLTRIPHQDSQASLEIFNKPNNNEKYMQNFRKSCVYLSCYAYSKKKGSGANGTFKRGNHSRIGM